jgi:hypothetical protein
VSSLDDLLKNSYSEQMYLKGTLHYILISLDIIIRCKVLVIKLSFVFGFLYVAYAGNKMLIFECR